MKQKVLKSFSDKYHNQFFPIKIIMKSNHYYSSGAEIRFKQIESRNWLD